MFRNSIDLPIFIDKSKRKKLRYSIRLGRLLHLLYLIAKHFMKEDIKERVLRHKAFEDLIKDSDLIKQVLRREKYSKDDSFERREEKVEKSLKSYLDAFTITKSRGYETLLKLIDIVMDLTFQNKLIKASVVYNKLLGIDASTFIRHKLAGKVSLNEKPFCIYIRNCRFIIVETIFEGGSKLSRNTIYLGSISDRDVISRLGLFANFSIKGVDASYIVEKHSKGYVFEIFGKSFKLYPTVLRMLRESYRKIRSVEHFKYEELRLISELYANENAVSSIITGETRANILAMVPSLALKGALCFPAVFEGELLEPLTINRKAVLKVADLSVDAYISPFNVLKYHGVHPGRYVFFGLFPVTSPRICMVLASYPLGILEKINKKERRKVYALNNLFPRIEEVVRIHET